MKSNQSILVATDFSAPATLAVERAARLAQGMARLCRPQYGLNRSGTQCMRSLTYFFDAIRQSAAWHTSIDRATACSAAMVWPRCRVTLATGRAATAIAERAKNIGASLAVIGIRARVLCMNWRWAEQPSNSCAEVLVRCWWCGRNRLCPIAALRSRQTSPQLQRVGCIRH